MKSAEPERRPILDALFDSAKGWPFSEEEVPLTRGKAPDGEPFVVVNVDGREIVVAEKIAAADDDGEGPTPHRIVAFLAFSGIAVSDTKILLQENLGTYGLPSWGLDDDGDLALSASIPVGASVPLDAARRQLLVGLGLIADMVGKILDAVSDEADGEATPNTSEMTKRFLNAL
jgi:hypothetical protein